MAKNLTVRNTTGVVVDFKILWQKDPQLSNKAIGIYVKIAALGLIEDWEFSVRGLAAVSKESEDSILTGIRELEEAGLLIRDRQRLDDGRVAGAHWVLCDSGSREHPTPKPPPPERDLPARENPGQAFPAQIKEESKKEEIKKEPPLPPAPKTRGTGEPLSVKVIPPDLQPVRNEILTFWDEHKGGRKTQKAWDDLMRNLMQILGDPKGGIAVIKDQLEKAEYAAIHGKKGPWQSISYKNWKRYEGTPSANGRGYSSPASRPGPKLKKQTEFAYPKDDSFEELF